VTSIEVVDTGGCGPHRGCPLRAQRTVQRRAGRPHRGAVGDDTQTARRDRCVRKLASRRGSRC